MDKLGICSWLFAGLFAVATPSFVSAQTLQTVSATKLDPASAVNLSGRQRMLSQRMVKAYLMLGQGIAPDQASSILQESIRLFDSQLTALKSFLPTPQVKSAYSNVEAEWKKFKPMVTTSPSKTGANDLYDANEALQNAAHKLTVAYENDANAPLVHLVAIAGRQRMLSQRMAKFYFYRTWELHDAPADMELHLARAHFTSMLIQIESSQLATPQVKSDVAKIQREWKPYEALLFATKEPAQMRKNVVRVAELSEKVLAATDELVVKLVSRAQASSP